MLTNTQLRYFDSEHVRLPRDKRTEYHAQVDRLIKTLSAAVKDQTDLRITSVVKAGSFAKFTILRKTSDDPVDVDVVFYLAGKNLDQASFESLSEDIHKVLIKLYPTKAVEDFELQKKAATVTFKGTGLAVDIVPVIQIETQPGFGYQFGTDGSKTKTCAPCQIEFVKTRKNTDSDYRTLVRLVKKWRNYCDIKPLKSFHIELILAFLQDRHGACDRIEQRFQDFFLYVAQSGLKETIKFPENKGVIGQFSDPVVIIDPVNNSNNAASRITEDERKLIVQACLQAWEIAHFASIEDNRDAWKELFGPRFKTED
jgi:hypothetical protein